MKILHRIKLWFLTRKPSSEWSETDKQKITNLINAQNKEKEVVREEVFRGEGKPYTYYYDNGMIRSTGHYYALGYDKKGAIQDEKFQGKNADYYDNGQIKEITFYVDGIPTGEYYSYGEDGKLDFSHPAGS